MAKAPKSKVKAGDKREAEKQNRMASHALADTMVEQFALLEGLDGTLDWDTIIDGIRADDPKARAAFDEVIAESPRGTLKKLKIREEALERITAQDIANQRAADERKYSKTGVALIRDLEKIGNVVKGIAGLPVLIPRAGANLLYLARVHTQDLLGIRPAMGVLIGTLGVSDAFIATAAYAASPHQTSYSNAHMMTAFQQACLSNGTTMGAAFDMAFSPEVNPNNNGFAYNAMKVAQMHGIPPLAAYLISYLESNRHRDLVSNNSSASGYMQFIDATALAYLHDMGKDTFTYKEAKAAIESGTGSSIDLATKRAIVMAIDAVAATDKETLRSMANNKKIPDAIFEGLTLANTSIMQVELVAIDMLDKTDIANADTPEDVIEGTAGYYGRDHFLGVSDYNVLEELARQFPSTPITSAEGVLGYKAGQKMVNVVARNPGLLEEGMTGGQALKSIEQSFTAFNDPVMQKLLAAYDPANSVPETCRADFAIAQGEVHTITKFDYTVSLAATAFTALTPSFLKGTSSEGETFAPSLSLSAKQTAQAPAPLERPLHLL